MLTNFTILASKGLVVRLGDKDKTIPILGCGTMHLHVASHNIAYSDVLYIPNLSAILLSYRVHRHTAPGCSFLADHNGCFLTYPDFTIEIHNDNDCTIPCTPISPEASLDFDACIHLLDHSSQAQA